MKSIYDMMGKYTYPALREEAPREHVESFFQVPGVWVGWGPWSGGQTGPPPVSSLSLSPFAPLSPLLDRPLAEDGQEQGWRGDH